MKKIVVIGTIIGSIFSATLWGAAISIPLGSYLTYDPAKGADQTPVAFYCETQGVPEDAKVLASTNNVMVEGFPEGKIQGTMDAKKLNGVYFLARAEKNQETRPKAEAEVKILVGLGGSMTCTPNSQGTGRTEHKGVWGASR